MKDITPKKKIKLLITALWIVVSVMIWLLIPSARKGPLGFGPSAAITTFQAEDASFSISYPSNWVAFNLSQGSHGDSEIIASILVSGKEFAKVNIARSSFADGNINDVVKWGQERAAQHTNYAPDSLYPLSNSEIKGFIQEYEWLHSTYDKIIMRCQDVYLLDNRLGYSLAFCSQEKDWLSLKDFFIQMRQSFSILGK